ncbi:hypothetical protein BX600DRAFT_532354 [Xylariales sp. PMI_506]|nr:hypothetical protein BX600DRAFT_532354 [Xylariales sp. PMI_506]
MSLPLPLSQKNPFRSPYKNDHHETYPAIDPTQPKLSTRGKSALVTGGGVGVGAAIALSLAKSGISQLALLARREDRLHESKAAIEALGTGTKVFTYAVDLTDAAAVGAAVDSFARETEAGTIDILIANAAYLPDLGALNEVDVGDWWSSFEVTVRGNLNLVRAFLPRATRGGGASIINVTTAATVLSYLPGYSGYRASKIAAYKLFEFVAYENPDIFVLHLHPGLIPTEGLQRFAASLGDVDPSTIPFDNVELSADFAVWAVSSEARFLNTRMVFANWDVDEIKADAEAIAANPERFTVGLIGWT